MTYPTITPLPDAPNRNDPDNFSTEADAFVAALPALVTETNTAGDYIEVQAVAAAGSSTTASGFASNASTSAGEAAASATSAGALAGAVAFVPSASYTILDPVISNVDFKTYRAKTTHSGVATDPSADATNWALINGVSATFVAANYLALAGGTMTGALVATAGITVEEVTETVFTMTGTDVDPANGTVQIIALTAARTLTESLVSGQAVRLWITGGDSWAITWPAGTVYIGGVAPVITATNILTMEKIGTDLIVYGGVGVA
jgi:hypothetical protein